MCLMLNPIADAPDHYHVFRGDLQVGEIYKRKGAIRPEAQWLWALIGMPKDSDGQAFAGLAATREEAMAALKERAGQEFGTSGAA
jgi:hypothetical protein